MGELILASGKVAKTPYTFNEIGIEVYTLEELCYVCYEYFEIVIEEFPKDSFVEWVTDEIKRKELFDNGLRIENDSNLIEFLKNSYLYHEEEIQRLTLKLQEWKLKSVENKIKSKGDIALRFRKYNEAINYYKKLPADENPDVLHNVGVIEMNLGQYKKAINSFHTAYKISDNLDSLMEYLLALLIDRQYELLFLELLKFSKKYSDARIWYVFGLYYEHQNDEDGALDSYHKAISSEPKGLWEPYERVVRIRLAKGQTNKAFYAIQDMETINVVEFSINLSFIYEHLLETDKAIELLEQIDIDEINKKKVYYRLSELYEKEGQIIKALDYIHKAKLIAGEDAFINIRIARLDKKVGLDKSYYETVDKLLEQWKATYRKQIS